MLKRIRIRGYKSLVDVDVELQPLSVLFGPNAAGKSNFLDALQLLSRIATCKTLKDAFDPPYRGKPLESFSFTKGGLEHLLTQDTAQFSIEVDVELADAVVATVNDQIRDVSNGKSSEGARTNDLVRERNLRYSIAIEVLPKSGILRVADEFLAALTGKGEVTKARHPFLERIGDRLHLRTKAEGPKHSFDRYLDHSILSMPVYLPHHPYLVAMRQELSHYFFFFFEPRNRMRAPNVVREVRHIGLMGEGLAAFLNTLRALDPRQFDAVQKSLRMIVPSVTGIDVDVNNLGEVDLWLLESGLRMPARVVSEGTLRVLGLLALTGAKEPPALLGFEEPENGIHPRRIGMIADFLQTRAETGDSQLIVTTHSPILLDLIPDDSLFVCRKDDGRTEISSFKTWGPLGRRKNIDEALDEEMSPSERIMRGDFDA